MKSWIIAAALVAAAASAGSAAAADLYGPCSYKDGPCDEPRYGDYYEQPKRPPYAEYRRYPDYRDHDKYARVPQPQAPVYRDEYRRYAEVPPPHYPPRYGDHRGQCLPKEVVRQALIREGWQDFHDPQIVDRDTASVRARRANGRLFSLHVDRCTGEILAARPLEPRWYGPYAGGPRRWERPY